MPACKGIHEQICDAHDGEMSPFRRFLYRAHLWICAPCRQTECSMKNTFNALRGLRDCAPFKPSETTPEK